MGCHLVKAEMMGIKGEGFGANCCDFACFSPDPHCFYIRLVPFCLSSHTESLEQSRCKKN